MNPPGLAPLVADAKRHGFHPFSTLEKVLVYLALVLIGGCAVLIYQAHGLRTTQGDIVDTQLANAKVGLENRAVTCTIFVALHFTPPVQCKDPRVVALMASKP